jgi:chorismate mutase / prephenate dehydratase
MSDLNDLRAKIDAIDTDLLRLLNERATVAQEIGAIKNREGLPIYSPEREDKVLRSLVERSDGPLTPEAIRAIYCEIMSASLALEKDVTIACLGPSGSKSHQAAKNKFGSSVRYLFFSTVEEVFQQVRSEADCGVVPIDDPEHGLANQTLDQLAETETSICAEIFLPSPDTGDADGGARFFVLGKNTNPPSGHDVTMLMLRIEDKPGALVSVLEPFKASNINLSHFASRPASRGSNDVFFFVEARGHTRDLQMVDLFRELSKRCRAVKILGSYPSATHVEPAA